MQPLKRIKRLWQLTKKDPKAIALLEKLTPAEIEKIPEDKPVEEGSAFFGPGTEAEFKEQELEDQGMKPWYERIKNL